MLERRHREILVTWHRGILEILGRRHRARVGRLIIPRSVHDGLRARNGERRQWCWDIRFGIVIVVYGLHYVLRFVQLLQVEAESFQPN
jgi:hypothetical protein